MVRSINDPNTVTNINNITIANTNYKVLFEEDFLHMFQSGKTLQNIKSVTNLELIASL